MSIVICLFILAMVYLQRKSMVEERMKQKLYQQNKTINLLAAENERNRIGRDLHDTLVQLVKGEVDILSPANPTTIRVVLKEGEMP